MDFVRMGVNLQRQELYEGNKVRFGAPSRHLQFAMTGLGIHRNKKASPSRSLIFVVLLGNLPWSGRQRPAGLFQQLFAFFTQADYWLTGIVRLGVKPKQVVHPLAVFGRDFSDAPHHFAPRLTDVFFRKLRNLSRLFCFMPLSLRAAWVSSRIVQRLAPSGGCEQTKATTLVS